MMNKIINGKKYDTDTAKEIDYWDNGLQPNDYNFHVERLFLKKTGEYFGYFPNGVPCHFSFINECNECNTIIPFTESEAKEWSQYRLTGTEYECIFGEVEE